jgi:5-methylcytosine-specific restriction enzyme A
MHPFGLGQEYPRQALLDFVGSRQGQPGVIWGNREPGCVICTSGGRHGKKAGYADGEGPDGTWVYFGQGTSGNQELGNAANAKLASREKSVLLFTTREPTKKEVERQGWGKLYTFRGSFNVSGFDFFHPESGTRAGERLIRFYFVPADDARVEGGNGRAEGEIAGDALADLRKQLAVTSPGPAPARMSAVEYRARSAAVHKYALLRGNGTCECCGKPAPFVSERGVPYLEVHHLKRLADDGPDHPLNVAAVCPNCHRELHLSVGRQALGLAVVEKVRIREQEIAAAEATSGSDSNPAARAPHG